MRTKVLTGVVISIAFILIAWFAPAAVLAALVVVACAVGALEMVRLCGEVRSAPLAVVLSAIVPLGAWFYGTWGMLFAVAFGVCAIALKAATSGRDPAGIVSEAKALAVCILFCGLLFAMWIPVVLVSQQAGYSNWIFWAPAGIWSNDIGAYFGGRFLGKRRLSRLSPKKTVEGLIAGSITSTLFFFIVGNFTALGPWWGLILGVLVSVLAPVGDLFESAFKRAAGAKDSGALFPGHGGVLDRTDSILASAPAVLFVLKLKLGF